MKTLVLLVLFSSTLLAQEQSKRDSTVLITKLDQSVKVKKRLNHATDIYSFDLYEFHRPEFKSIRGLLPHQGQWNWNNFDLSSLFSGMYSFRSLQENWLDSLAFSAFSLEQKTTEIINSNAVTKITIFDGDFFYSNVDGSFYQRVSDALGLYFGFRNIEANNRIEGGITLPQIRSSLHYFFESGEKIILDYFFQRYRWSDYGYLVSENWQQFSDESFKSIRSDEENHIFLRYQFNSKSELAFRFTEQEIAHDFSTKFRELSQYGTKKELRYTYTDKKTEYILSYYDKSLRSNYYSGMGYEKAVKITSRWKIKDLDLQVSASPLYAEEKTLITTDIPFSIFLKNTHKNLKFDFLFRNKRPSFNHRYLETPNLQNDILPYEQAYFFPVKHSFSKLKSEKITSLKLAYDVFQKHSFVLRGNVVKNPIQFSFPDSSFVNEKLRYDLSLSHHLSHHFFSFLGVESNIYYAFSRKNTYLPDLEANFSLLSRFRIFKQLNVDLRLTQHYLGNRAYLYYMSKADFFSIDSSQEQEAKQFTSFEANFKIRSALIRLRIHNLFRDVFSRVRGYEAKARGVEFGVEWIFND